MRSISHNSLVSVHFRSLPLEAELAIKFDFTLPSLDELLIGLFLLLAARNISTGKGQHSGRLKPTGFYNLCRHYCKWRRALQLSPLPGSPPGLASGLQQQQQQQHPGRDSKWLRRCRGISNDVDGDKPTHTSLV